MKRKIPHHENFPALVPPGAPVAVILPPRKKTATGFNSSQRMTKRKPDPRSCGNCKHTLKTETGQLVCYGAPPAIVVIDGKAQNFRPGVAPNEPACGMWKASGTKA